MSQSIICPICKNYHQLKKFLECDFKVTRKLSKYKKINTKKLIKEFNIYSQVECLDCSQNVSFDYMYSCSKCGELLCLKCYTDANIALCKTCYTDTQKEKCKFCKDDCDMYRSCVKCYERICWACILRCRGCNQIICPQCDVFGRICINCFDEKQFYLKFYY